VDYSSLSPDEIREKMFKCELCIIRQKREIQAMQELVRDNEKKMIRLREAYLEKMFVEN